MGVCVLITRPKAQAEGFAAALETGYGGPVRCVISPLIEIVPLAVDGTFDDVEHVIFTSVNGVNEARRIGIPLNIPAWCVGAKTASLASKVGFNVRVAGGDSQSLVSLIAAQKPKGRMVHIRGRHVAGTVIESLDATGISCEAVVAYDQVAVAPTQAAIDLLKGCNPVIVPLFSPRSGTLFCKIAGNKAPLHVVSISDAIDISDLGGPIKSHVIAKNDAGMGILDLTVAAYERFCP